MRPPGCLHNVNDPSGGWSLRDLRPIIQDEHEHCMHALYQWLCQRSQPSASCQTFGLPLTMGRCGSLSAAVAVCCGVAPAVLSVPESRASGDSIVAGGAAATLSTSDALSSSRVRSANAPSRSQSAVMASSAGGDANMPLPVSCGAVSEAVSATGSWIAATAVTPKFAVLAAGTKCPTSGACSSCA